MRPIIGAQTSVYTVQNGVEAADVVGAVLGRQKVVPGIAYISAIISEPGLISTRAAFAGLAFGERDGRESARVKAFFDACKAAKFDAQIPPDITRAIWLKFAMLAPMAATTSLIRCGLGPIRSNPHSRALLQALIEEIVTLGKAAASDERPGYHRYTEDSRRMPPAVRASMAHDLEVGNPLELPWLSGAVVRTRRATWRGDADASFLCRCARAL